jgi:hypothetical protein
MAARFFRQENTRLGVERWRRNYFANESSAPGLVVSRLVRIPYSPRNDEVGSTDSPILCTSAV